MQQHLKILTQVLDELDSDPNKSLLFYTGLLPKEQQNHKPPDVKWNLLVSTLSRVEEQGQTFYGEKDVPKIVHGILEDINSKYQQHQNLCWRSHEHHFHVSFDQYVNCPVTCLAEISEFLQKLDKEIYTQ